MKTQAPEPNASGLPLNALNATSSPDVLILYEDFTTGLRAKYALDRLAHQLDLGTDFFNLRLWSFGLLLDPNLRSQSARQANDFEIIIFSAHDGGEPPSTVKEWILEWLKHKRAPRCAFVVSLDQPAMPVAEETPLVAYLKSVAPDGVDLLCPVSEPPAPEPDGGIRQLMRRATNSSPVLEAILNQWEAFPRWGASHWGINE